ncbi:hypothetical protein GCM10010191_48470 [Actinomadura vinacea]|uniref:YbaB/EbfC family DNA-binding protein n=1 Tax=Actinomadura vinacea TaxID=115336 RepID=A0ABN3JGB8_9ACTN
MSESENAPEDAMARDLAEAMKQHLARLGEIVRWQDTAIGRAPSPNLLVKAGWANGKGLTELEISEPAMAMDPAFLAATIRTATGQARRDLLRQAQEMVADLRREAEELLDRLDAIPKVGFTGDARATLLDTRDWWRGYVESLHKLTFSPS